jgi:hypothetical protein
MRLFPLRHRAAFAALSLCTMLAPAAVAAAEEDVAPWDRETPHRALGVSVGIGFAFPSSSSASGSGQGAFARAEYVFWPSSWFTPRLYSGIEVAPRQSNCSQGVTPCDVSAEFGFIGAKGRLLVPIPWIAPYLELGVGGAAGHFSTRSGYAVNRTFDGVTYEIPFALGIALGSRRQFEVAFEYLFHPAMEQFAGGVGVGLRVPLG